MKFCFNDMLLAVSKALDCVEGELVGVSTDHARRVACLCIYMGKHEGYEERKLSDLAGYALLHDNALTEYIQTEVMKTGKKEIRNLGLHCIFGERNIKDFPFFSPVDHAILYHHENADGSGPFGKKAEEIPLYAGMIHLADQVDVRYNLRRITPEKYKKVRQFLKNEENKLFGPKEVQMFLEGISYEDLKSMEEEHIVHQVERQLPKFQEEFTPDNLKKIAALFAKIIDYKSTFTSMHSIGIAKKAWDLGDFYGFDEEKKAKLYLAGGLHDIGKLAIDNAILEKPGKLTAEEYGEMKRHAMVSYEILHDIEGFEDITEWAALHHEKLDGSGYPFGYTAEKLGKEARMMACVDIYEALEEVRPYKPAKTHQEIMTILYDLANKNALDRAIVEDIDQVFRSCEGKAV